MHSPTAPYFTPLMLYLNSPPPVGCLITHPIDSMYPPTLPPSLDTIVCDSRTTNINKEQLPGPILPLPTPTSHALQHIQAPQQLNMSTASDLPQLDIIPETERKLIDPLPEKEETFLHSFSVVDLPQGSYSDEDSAPVKYSYLLDLGSGFDSAVRQIQDCAESHGVIAVACHGELRPNGYVSVIAIGISEKRSYIFDVMSCPDMIPRGLSSLMANEKIVKVTYDSSETMRALSQMCRIKVSSLLDLNSAHAILKQAPFHPRTSFLKLLQDWCKVKKPVLFPQHWMGLWRSRPLGQDLLRKAAYRAALSLTVYMSMSTASADERWKGGCFIEGSGSSDFSTFSSSPSSSSSSSSSSSGAEALESPFKNFFSFDDDVEEYFLGDYKHLEHEDAFQGHCLGDEMAARHWEEYALLGSRADSQGRRKPVYLNTSEPFCMAAVGVQGGGKSHTVGCILESCLLQFPSSKVVHLDKPMTTMVLHYDTNPDAKVEATGLMSPNTVLEQMLHTNSKDGAPCQLDLTKVVVLTSPCYFKQRQQYYGRGVTVKPLLFKWSRLTSDHVKRIMKVKEEDNQLYVSVMTDILRQYQRNNSTMSLDALIQQIQKQCNLTTQTGPLAQRIQLLQSIVQESSYNSSISHLSSDLYDACKPGKLVIVDLTDPMLASSEANSIFQILVEQFRTLGGDVTGKLLVLDEAHKYMHGVESDGLSQSVVNMARLMRHDNMRLAVSTQSPSTLAPELLELISLAVLHRFHSHDWYRYLSTKLPLEQEDWERILELRPGEALVFASRKSFLSEEGEEGESKTGKSKCMQVKIRARLTADKGGSMRN
eukprot:767127-Hanusia_phi.AAC.3